MSWRKHFTPVDNSGLPINVQPKKNTDNYGALMSRFESWLPEVYAGSPNRLMRYQQYNNMDADSEINKALDTIAEFGTQLNETTGLPFRIDYTEAPSETESKIIVKTLTRWCNLNDFHKRMFRIFRNVIKYGDQFFIRDPQTYELYWVDPANVEKVIVNESEGKEIETYFIKNLQLNLQQQLATTPGNLHTRPYGSGQGITGIMSPVAQTAGGSHTNGLMNQDQGAPVSAINVVHLSLSEGLDDSWPFGISILEPIFKVFKQKELLEDSIIIYRVHRAPERRVFFIDVGNMPPHRANQYLERMKLEVQQKRIPGKNRQGQNIVDSAYNPMCLALDTKIPLLDGRTLDLSTLIDEYKSGKENWVYSCNPETGAVVPGNITWAGITRTNAETIKITLDNNEEIVCTPDHKIPVLGKGFVEAQYLTEHDSLISFETKYRSLSHDKSRSYEEVYDHEANQWVFTHRMVAEFFRTLDKHQSFVFNEEYALDDKNVVHHKDYNRYNNDPRNLQWMNAKDHIEYHSFVKKDYWEKLNIQEAHRIKNKIRAGLEKYRKENRDDFLARYKNRDTSWIKEMKKTQPEKYQMWRSSLGRSRKEYLTNNTTALKNLQQIGKDNLSKNRAQNQRFNFTQDMLTRLVELVKEHNSNRLKTIEIANNDPVMRKLIEVNNPINPKGTKNIKHDFTNSKLLNMYSKYGYKNWKDFKEKTKVYNHRIRKIEVCTNQDVGTITIDFQEKWHNYHTFALKAGIFVKNSMLEDYFFAQTADGRGSKVDTLAGGENLGQIDDLKYFNNKMIRGLGIPSSYLPTGPDDGTATYNDGKVGIAYIQEYRFSNFVERLQRQIDDNLDREFKLYMKKNGIEIDSSTFSISLTEPMNFNSYRDMQLQAERVGLYSQVQGIRTLSEQFKLKKYLGLTDDEIKENESLWKKENAGRKNAPTAAGQDMMGMPAMGLDTMGIRPEPNDMVDLDAEPDLSDLEADMGDPSVDLAPVTPTTTEVPPQ